MFSVAFAGSLGLALRWRARRRGQSKLARAVNRHFGRLVGIRAQALAGDQAGPSGPGAWQQEIERFLDGAFSVALTRQELRRLEERKAQLARLVAERVRLGVTRLSAYQ